MSESTTRISELPENITYQVGNAPQIMGNIAQMPNPQSNSGHDDIGQNTYVPLNIHPNPYGGSQQPSVPPPPPQNIKQRFSEEERYELPQQRLPSRDIPINTLDYQHDEEIHANYVPKAKLTSDYIRQYEEASEETMRKHEKERHRERLAKSIWEDLQVPLLIAILYFIFQMPIVTTLLYKYFSFLSIYSTDGNMNFSGLLLKSALFGSLFFGIQKITDLVTSL